jgi:hypothetical protein
VPTEGWSLQLLQDGLEVGGGAFPTQAGASDLKATLDEAHAEAVQVGKQWMAGKTAESPGPGEAGQVDDIEASEP